MKKSRPKIKVAASTTSDITPSMISDFGRVPFSRKDAKRTIDFIQKHHIKIKDKLYHSDSIEHVQYFPLLFNFFQSFKAAFDRDEALAVQVLFNAYRKNLDYLNRQDRPIHLSSFYCMCLEVPEKRAMILSQAALFTIASAFFVLYSSLIKHGNFSTPAYPNESGEKETARTRATEILLRAISDIEKAGIIQVSQNAE